MKEALKMALEAIKNSHEYRIGNPAYEQVEAKIEEALAQPEQDNTYGYASRLATAIWQKHYMKDAPKWKPLNTTEGVLTQIDNMTCGLVKEKPAQLEQEPVAWLDEYGNAFPLAAKQYSVVGKHWKPLYTTPPQRTCENCGEFGTCCLHDAQNKENT